MIVLTTKLNDNDGESTRDSASACRSKSDNNDGDIESGTSSSAYQVKNDG